MNEVNVDGGRVSAMWRPSGSVSVKLGAYLQNVEANGSPTVHELPGLDDLEHSMIRGAGGYEKKIQIYSANVRAELGAAELSYIGGYSINELDSVFDYTPAFGPVTEPTFGVSGTPLIETQETKRLTQELRLSLPLTDSIDGLFGLFFSDERTRTRKTSSRSIR